MQPLQHESRLPEFRLIYLRQAVSSQLKRLCKFFDTECLAQVVSCDVYFKLERPNSDETLDYKLQTLSSEASSENAVRKFNAHKESLDTSKDTVNWHKNRFIHCVFPRCFERKSFLLTKCFTSTKSHNMGQFLEQFL